MYSVISVGNLAFGGRGKTPLVAAIARRLAAAGARPAILSRGYARRDRAPGAVVVSDGTHLLADLDRAGDEPLMLARALPGVVVVVCDVRTIAAAIARHTFGATVMILDDGFQHRAIRRDVDLVLVTPEDLRDQRAPFGRLRESPSALSRAAAVIVDGPAPAALPQAPRAKVFTLSRALGTPIPLEAERPWPAGRGPVVALSGIAGPDRFRRGLEANGWTVAKSVTYRDHHRYEKSEVEALAEVVAASGATGVLTTEKDAVRLLPWRPFPVPIAAVPLTVTVEPQDAFQDWLDARLREARA